MAVRFGPFSLDAARRHLLEGQVVHLTPKAFDVLLLLVNEAPRVISERELHQRLWPTTFVSDATLVGLVKELRRALHDHDEHAPMIRTVHRVGYAFCPEVHVAGAAAHARVWHWLVFPGRRIGLCKGENSIAATLDRTCGSMSPACHAGTPASSSAITMRADRKH